MPSAARNILRVDGRASIAEALVRQRANQRLTSCWHLQEDLRRVPWRH